VKLSILGPKILTLRRRRKKKKSNLRYPHRVHIRGLQRMEVLPEKYRGSPHRRQQPKQLPLKQRRRRNKKKQKKRKHCHHQRRRGRLAKKSSTASKSKTRSGKKSGPTKTNHTVQKEKKQSAAAEKKEKEEIATFEKEAGAHGLPHWNMTIFAEPMSMILPILWELGGNKQKGHML